MLWHYVKPYIAYALIAAVFMVGEVCMDLFQPSLMSSIIDEGVLGSSNNGVGDMNVVLSYGLMMCGIAVAGVICGSANNVFVQIAKQNVGNSLRKDIYRNIMGMSFPQIEHFGTGALITRVTNDVTHIEMMVSVFVRGMIRTGVMLVGSIVMLFMINPGFGVVLLVAFPVALVFMFVCLRVVNPLFLRIQQFLDRLNSIMQEDLNGIRTVKSFVREVYEKARFGKANDELIKTQLKALLIFAFMSPFMNVVMYGAIGGLLYVGYLGSLAGDISPGSVIASLSYATQLLMSIMGVVMLSQDISRGTTSWKRVKEILACEPAMKDGDYKGTREDKGASVEFADVSFSYPGASAPVLASFDLSIKPGECIAIMGPTGCGKSTLASLMARFYDVSSGSVCVEGVDVREWDRTELRRTVVVALQKTELFWGTVEENVAQALDIQEHSSSVVDHALQAAQAAEFVEEMPGGVKVELCTGGSNLSGGQRQRLGIARALAASPRVLVLDDSTSALDTRTEARFLKALDEEFGDVTRVIIAQRVSTARSADRIVVMDDGHILGCGTHDELLRDCALYQEIVASQSQVGAYAE